MTLCIRTLRRTAGAALALALLFCLAACAKPPQEPSDGSAATTTTAPAAETTAPGGVTAADTTAAPDPTTTPDAAAAPDTTTAPTAPTTAAPIRLKLTAEKSLKLTLGDARWSEDDQLPAAILLTGDEVKTLTDTVNRQAFYAHAARPADKDWSGNAVKSAGEYYFTAGGRTLEIGVLDSCKRSRSKGYIADSRTGAVAVLSSADFTRLRALLSPYQCAYADPLPSYPLIRQKDGWELKLNATDVMELQWAMRRATWQTGKTPKTPEYRFTMQGNRYALHVTDGWICNETKHLRLTLTEMSQSLLKKLVRLRAYAFPDETVKTLQVTSIKNAAEPEPFTLTEEQTELLLGTLSRLYWDRNNPDVKIYENYRFKLGGRTFITDGYRYCLDVEADQVASTDILRVINKRYTYLTLRADPDCLFFADRDWSAVTAFTLRQGEKTMTVKAGETAFADLLEALSAFIGRVPPDFEESTGYDPSGYTYTLTAYAADGSTVCTLWYKQNGFRLAAEGEATLVGYAEEQTGDALYRVSERITKG